MPNYEIYYKVIAGTELVRWSQIKDWVINKPDMCATSHISKLNNTEKGFNWVEKFVEVKGD